jgi:purine-nucleoside phosphorylase
MDFLVNLKSAIENPMRGRTLYLFSSTLELNAGFPDGVPDDLLIGITGVGLVDAALGAARAIAEHRPDAVVYLGTCGAHRESGIAVGELLVASEAVLGSGDVAHGWMRLPKILCARLQTDEVLSRRFTDVAGEAGQALRPASVSCTLGITESDELADALYRWDGSGTENLEVFPVLRAADGIPATALLGVTNIVGAGGGADWAANYRTMMRKLASLIPGG